ncbi:unnamed protein product [Arctogadus glacialis]
MSHVGAKGATWASEECKSVIGVRQSTHHTGSPPVVYRGYLDKRWMKATRLVLSDQNHPAPGTPNMAESGLDPSTSLCFLTSRAAAAAAAPAGLSYFSSSPSSASTRRPPFPLICVWIDRRALPGSGRYPVSSNALNQP